MLYHIIRPVMKYLTGMDTFSYITVRSIIAFVISFALCLIAFPIFIKKMKEWKLSQIIRNEGPQTHLSKVGTPAMGGIVVIIAMLISMAICGNFYNDYTMVIIFVTITLGIVGFVDDYLKITKKSSDGLQAKFKLIQQILIALIVSTFIYFILGDKMSYIAVPFLKNVKIHLSFFYIPVGAFIIVASSNAVNLTDGLDGLAAGLLIAVVATFGILAYISGHKELSEYLLIDHIPISAEILVYCFAFMGGLAGFLWFNAHPAEIFMGDTGSLSFGGIIGTMSLMIKQELLLMIVGGVFVAETLSVIIQVISFKYFRKRVFLMAPLHHHFELKGWKESKIITRFWIFGGLLALVALGTLKLR